MRTKNAKRLWPIPATLAVVALAAFLAFGLMATTGAQSAAAQAAEPDVNVVPPATASAAPLTGLGAVMPGTKSIAGRQATIQLAGLASPDALNMGTETHYFVYAEGGTISGGRSLGSAYPESTASDTAVSEGTKSTIHYREVTVGPPTFDGNKRTAATETITVTRGSLKVVNVFIYTATPTDSFIEDAEVSGVTGTIDRVRESTESLVITFQDPADPDNSDIMIATDDLATTSHASLTVSTTLTVTVKDGADAPEGGNPLEGKVEITVGGPATVLLQQVIDGEDDKVGKTITVDTNDQGLTPDITVIGIPGADAVRIPVDAKFGAVSLKTKYLTRVGPATRIEAGIYNYDSDCVDQGDADAEVITDDTFDPTDDDCETDMRFGRGEKFVIDAVVKDALGSDREDQVEITLPDVDDLLEDAASYGSTDANTMPPTDVFNVYEVGSKASYGMQTITLAVDNNDKVADVELTFYVSGPPVKYVVDPKETYIPVRSRDTFTITALDTTNGIPHFADDMASMVQIDAPYGEVRGVMVDSNDVLTLDTATGMGTFTYTLPRDAVAGEAFSIFVGEGDTEVEITVRAGDAPTAPGMPMNVMAMATSHDMITVTWDAADDGGSDITGYVLQRKTGTMDFMTIAASSAEIWWNTLDCQMMNAEIPDDATPAPPMDDTDMTSPYCAMYAGLSAEATTVVDGVFAAEYGTISGTSHSDMGLMAETTYYYRVAAMNSVGMGDYSDGMAMAMTIEAAEPEEVGPATGVTTGPFNEGGVIQVNWDAAPNATGYIIYAVNVDELDDPDGQIVIAAVNDATAETYTLSGLKSGDTYEIYVVATAKEMVEWPASADVVRVEAE